MIMKLAWMDREPDLKILTSAQQRIDCLFWCMHVYNSWVWSISLEVEMITFRVGRKIIFDDKWVCIELEKCHNCYIGLPIYMLTNDNHC